jgi:hypothetical protein
MYALDRDSSPTQFTPRLVIPNAPLDPLCRPCRESSAFGGITRRSHFCGRESSVRVHGSESIDETDKIRYVLLDILSTVLIKDESGTKRYDSHDPTVLFLILVFLDKIVDISIEESQRRSCSWCWRRRTCRRPVFTLAVEVRSNSRDSLTHIHSRGSYWQRNAPAVTLGTIKQSWRL